MVRMVGMALLTATLALGGAQASGAEPVSVYPSPWTRVASPRTQISIRGIAPGAIGPLQITGSRSGRHAGKLQAHSDGRGASFVPAVPFLSGEVVSVHTTLDVRGAHDGDYHLGIATTGMQLGRPAILSPKLRGPGVQRFASRPDLVPAKLTASAARPGLAPGDLFVGKLALRRGTGQNGPMVLDPRGKLIWFQPLSGRDLALDVRVQRYQGQPVLTWWQGWVGRGVGAGKGVILDRSYGQIATVKAGNGYKADPHEFQLTARDTALVLAEAPVVWDISSIHGARRANVLDSIVQEIDVKTGLVLFEWHSLDHVGVSDSYARPVRKNGHVYDYFHVNSVAQMPSGDFVVSGRNSWTIYKLDGRSGAVEWRLGGKHSSFKQRRGATFAWQHDARVQPDGTITLFDNGAAPPVHSQSEGVGIHLDTHRMRAWRTRKYRHTPKLLAGSQGDAQALPNGNVLVGWGAQPFATEFDRHGNQLVDYRFPAGDESYRAYRFPWDPQPAGLPAVAASRQRDGTTKVFASWNGAANVARWVVFAGVSPTSLAPVTSAPRRDFETTISLRTAAPFVAVQAKSAAGAVLARSPAVAVSPPG